MRAYHTRLESSSPERHPLRTIMRAIDSLHHKALSRLVSDEPAPVKCVVPHTSANSLTRITRSCRVASSR